VLLDIISIQKAYAKQLVNQINFGIIEMPTVKIAMQLFQIVVNALNLTMLMFHNHMEFC